MNHKFVVVQNVHQMASILLEES